jgi:hypothetical protein
MSAVHTMRDQLDYSHRQADAPWWEEVYRQAFPDMDQMIDLRDDMERQRQGIDRAIVLRGGRHVFVDEKARKECWPDMALEVQSVYPKNGRPPFEDVPNSSTKGWARNPKLCDYVAYAFVPCRTCYLLPLLSVRSMMDRHGGEFIERAGDSVVGPGNGLKRGEYGWIVAPNDLYDSISIAVPLKDFFSYLQDTMTVKWSAA